MRRFAALFGLAIVLLTTPVRADLLYTISAADIGTGNPYWGTHTGNYEDYGTIRLHENAAQTQIIMTVNMAPGWGFDQFGFDYFYRYTNAFLYFGDTTTGQLATNPYLPGSPGTVTSVTGTGSGAAGSNSWRGSWADTTAFGYTLPVGNSGPFGDTSGNFTNGLFSNAPGGESKEDTTGVFTITGTHLQLEDLWGANDPPMGLRMAPLDPKGGPYWWTPRNFYGPGEWGNNYYGEIGNGVNVPALPSVSTPEPSGLVLAGLGVVGYGLGLVMARRRSRKSGS
jgi:hypothetical protein